MESASTPAPAAPSVNVVCMKWGGKYGPEYVNILRAMVERHLARNHRFFCFTEDERGLATGIETRPLPEMRVPRRPETEAWRKLSLFSPEVSLAGPSLFLDLDVVVTGGLDVFFELDGDFRAIHNWTHPHRSVANSSVFRFEPGTLVDVFSRFNAEPDRIAESYANEQTYLSECVGRRGQLAWWPDAWCRSFKRHCLRGRFQRLWRPAVLPSDCRIVVFHGRPNPPEAATRWIYRTDKAYRLPKFARPSRWILDYWK